MAMPNVQRILYLRNDAHGRTLTHEEFRAQFHFEPDGVNAYYGVNAEAVQHFDDTGLALRQHHSDLFADVRDALTASARLHKTVILSLLPFQPPDPFTFVHDNLPLIRALAGELAAFQVQAAEGKHLRIIVRYASEMNDPRTDKQPYGREPNSVVDRVQQRKFKDSFAAVREAFRSEAPGIAFTFSPALRSDITGPRYKVLPQYWPGDDVVDRISSTWFVGQQANLSQAIEVLRRYHLHRVGRGLPFGIDEMGGVNGASGNDNMLQQMFSALAGLQPNNIHFDYVTVFLVGKWGNDATLDFLRDDGE